MNERTLILAALAAVALVLAIGAASAQAMHPLPEAGGGWKPTAPLGTTWKKFNKGAPATYRKLRRIQDKFAQQELYPNDEVQQHQADMLAAQYELQKQQELVQFMTNAMKKQHEIAMNVIGNIK